VELRRIEATRYVTPLREGGSLPALVEASDDGLYVLKFRGAGQGRKALVAEVVAGELARARAAGAGARARRARPGARAGGAGSGDPVARADVADRPRRVALFPPRAGRPGRARADAVRRDRRARPAPVRGRDRRRRREARAAGDARAARRGRVGRPAGVAERGRCRACTSSTCSRGWRSRAASSTRRRPPERIAAGEDGTGPIAELDGTARFHWLVSPASTVIQPSAVHTGVCTDPQHELDKLFRTLVELPREGG
jgi:hypothetical protein